MRETLARFQAANPKGKTGKEIRGFQGLRRWEGRRVTSRGHGPNYDPVRLLRRGSARRSAGHGTISALVCMTVGGSWVEPRRSLGRGSTMPRGDKSKYTDKQKRQAEKIEEGYEERGVSEKEAERRAWATVNA